MATQILDVHRQFADESRIREEVLSTHNHDGRAFEANFVLTIVENILSLEMGTTKEAITEKSKQLEVLNYQELPFHIRQLSLEMASGLNTENQHLTAINVLRMLSPYPWEAKVVLMLAAFSIIYGEICLVSRFHERKILARKLAQLKQMQIPPNKKFVVDCVNSVLALTKCIVELFTQSPSYSAPPSVISALPMASYWIATSLVSCAANCARFELQNEIVELTTLIAKILNNTFSPELEKKKAEESYEALRYALYNNNSSNNSDVFRLMFNVKDDYEPIFHSKGLLSMLPMLPMLRKVGINGWNRRRVLLLITSGTDISIERIHFLNWVCRLISSPRILWIPIMHNDAPLAIELSELKDYTRFHWLDDPQKRVLPQFIRFVKDEHFLDFQIGGEPILVSLDQRGRIVHPNVMHMIFTWGPDHIQKNTLGVRGQQKITSFIEKELKEGTSGVDRVVPEIDKMISDLVLDINTKVKDWTNVVEDRIRIKIEESTPYESQREKDLWEQLTAWSLHLLIARFNPYMYWKKPHIDFYTCRGVIDDWVKEEKYSFLYGGNDIKWIREFTSKVHEVRSKTELKVELAYFGKNKMIRATIDNEKMSDCPLDDSNKVWFFWTRLRSMFLSRIRYLQDTNHFGEESNDETLQVLKKLLAYEGKNSTIEGWALLSKGEKMVVCGHGAKMLLVMKEYEIWKESIATKGFDQAFKGHHEMLVSSSSSNSHSCCTLEYPNISSKIPENENCVECSHRMIKFVTFTCCHDHDVDSDRCR